MNDFLDEAAALRLLSIVILITNNVGEICFILRPVREGGHNSTKDTP